MHNAQQEWTIPADVTFLNHGSFGPTPRIVQATREAFSRRLASQPMQFFLREFETELDHTLQSLAAFVGATPDELVLVDNATTAMNIVARSFPLAAGDSVLITDHDYGAVHRIWRVTCAASRSELITVPIPTPVSDPAELIDPILAGLRPATRLVIVSHVTSPTAIVWPVEKLALALKDRGVALCVDGPHALAMLPLRLKSLGCDFYCGSLHKWLSAPIGSGFLLADRKWIRKLTPPCISWGRSVSGRPDHWRDPFHWQGTRDAAAWLAVPAAIDFLQTDGRLKRLREAGHALAAEARRRLEAFSGRPALVPDSAEWYGTMISVPLPTAKSLRRTPNSADPLQQKLWEQHRIEVPIVDWKGQRLIRVSCHLYNDQTDIDHLLKALEQERALA